MSKKVCVHIFHRDLRLNDNSALNATWQQGFEVLPLFIFTPQQTGDNPYKSRNGLQFLVESLEALDSDLSHKGSQLYCYYAASQKALRDVIETLQPDAVSWNADYTPFAIQRDNALRAVCKSTGVQVIERHDALLVHPDLPTTGTGGRYKVFTPFKKWVLKNANIPSPHTAKHQQFYSGNELQHHSLEKALEKFEVPQNQQLFTHGGRENGLALLSHIHTFADYSETRNTPSIAGTTGLSAHHKFGTVSIRESFHSVQQHFGEDSQLISELIWRDFYTHIAYHWPEIFTSDAWKTKYETVEWTTDKKALDQWQKGLTGFPIIDAGMRQLVVTGWMHNRVRMIVACFLCKDLHQHWRAGEQFFAQHLVDFDPSVNNGSWQWAASTGADSQPYFRIFNPWTQQKRFDADCKYIKQWVPELRELDAKIIHNWHAADQFLSLETAYPLPMVDHKTQAAEAKLRFKMVGEPMKNQEAV